MLIIYSPFPSLKSAKETAKILVSERLIACANILKSTSVFSWNGRITDEAEFILIAKTRDSFYKRVEDRLQDLHPYEIPAIFSFKASNVLGPYDQWVTDCCRPRK